MAYFSLFHWVVVALVLGIPIVGLVLLVKLVSDRRPDRLE